MDEPLEFEQQADIAGERLSTVGPVDADRDAWKTREPLSQLQVEAPGSAAR